ncbi:MAG TPA: D-alanine--D-alanine ligase [Myxococcota bacterium]|nr:D-alanine--D-alanine ligase [Myxococcota bacterium]
MRALILHDRIGDESAADARDVLAQVALVERALARAGREPIVLAVDLDLAALARRVRELAPSLVFNLVESLGGSARLIPVVPALLEELGTPFSGSPAEALFTTSNKTLAKRLLSAAGLPTPEWVDARSDATQRERFGTWIAKPVWEDASVGIDDAAVSSARAADALAARSRVFPGELFAEAYVDGREINLSLLADGDGVRVLPPAEIRFVDYPDERPRICGYASKWHEQSFEYHHTPRHFDFPASDEPLLARIAELGRRCWELFGLRDYARVDFRVDAKGRPWILELNANPCLSEDAGFVAAAAQAGIAPEQVVLRIAEAALARATGGARR